MAKLPAYIQRIKNDKTLEELIAEINEAGWQVNNWFQLPDGMWRANLRIMHEVRGQIELAYHEYADAYTAEEAMAAAIWNARHRKVDMKTGRTKPDDKVTEVAVRQLELARQELTAALKQETQAWR